ncbi:hypothetical protein BGZ51_009653, partial [Haplosporangium sp. Z 767]
MKESDSANSTQKDAPMEDTLIKDIKDDDDNVNGTLSNAQSGCPSNTEVSNTGKNAKMVVQWYFKAADTPSHELLELECSQGFTKGLYNVIVGVSVDSLTISRIESITFTIKIDYLEMSEIIKGHNLAALCVSGNGINKWKLHHQVDRLTDDETTTITMEIRTSASSYPDPEAGYLDLHFVELHQVTPWTHTDESDLIRHQPYLWSIDVNNTYRYSAETEEWSKIIFIHDMSGDGRVGATLSQTRTYIHLELWDTSNPAESDTNSCRNPDDDAPHQRPYHPVRIAGIDIAVEGLSQKYNTWDLSLSWDGSHVALLDTRALKILGSKENHTSLFAIYDCQPGPFSSTAVSSLLPPSPSASPMTLSLSNHYQHCPGLQEFHGYGKFHITAIKDQDIKNELFMAWDMESIRVYSAFGDWKLLHILSFATSFYFDPVLACHGRHFAWSSGLDGVISIWDIDQGSLVHVLLNQQKTSFHYVKASISQDGSMLAIYRNRMITVHWMATGAAFGSYTMPGEPVAFYNLHFINGGTQLMLLSEHHDRDIGWGRIGIILDVSTMCVANKFVDMYGCSPRYSESATDQNPFIGHGSKLDLIRLDDCVVQQFSHGRQDCHDQCINNLTPLAEQPTEYISPNGLHFQAKRHPPGVDADLQSIIVLVSNGDAEPVKKLVLPSLSSKSHILWTYLDAVFLAHTRQFVVTTTFYHVILWDMPTTMEDDFELILFWQLKEDSAWGMCNHHQLYAWEIETAEKNNPIYGTVIQPCRNQIFCKETSLYFLFGMYYYGSLFACADETFKSVILRYINTHINSYPDQKDHEMAVMYTIC